LPKKFQVEVKDDDAAQTGSAWREIARKREAEIQRLQRHVAELEAERDRMAPVVAAAVDWYSAEVHELNLEDAIYAYIHPETTQPK
jgi:ubiquinone biosynthesis protein UbiJ